MRPRRLPEFDYRGCHRYFVTCCCWQRQLHFANASVVAQVAPILRSSLADRDFACLAWVFMPDHLHLLVEGTSNSADLRSAMKLARQRTALMFQRLRQKDLWQEGYYERVLRREEDTEGVIAYILNNPVRAGLVAEWQDFEFSWSAGTEDGARRPQL